MILESLFLREVVPARVVYRCVGDKAVSCVSVSVSEYRGINHPIIIKRVRPFRLGNSCHDNRGL